MTTFDKIRSLLSGDPSPPVTVQQYAKEARFVDDLQVGLFEKADGSQWIRNPDGSETQVGAGDSEQTLEQVLTAGNDGGDLQVKNLAAGTDPGDAATVSQLNTIFSVTRHALFFTETSGDGTYTGQVVVPPGTSILSVATFVLAGPWVADEATLTIGDEAYSDGYLPADYGDLVNLLNTPYDAAAAALEAAASWADSGTFADDPIPVYSDAASWYSGGGRGGVGYIATVRYPNGGTITATVVASGGYPDTPSAIKTTSLENGGSGYAPGDTGRILQGDSNDATYVVDTVDGDGSILTYAITNPGSGYIIDDAASEVVTGDGDGNFSIFILELEFFLASPGQLVVDVIGFGVPPGENSAEKS